MYELNRLLKKYIQDEINDKITGKCNVTIIDNTLIVEIAPKHLSDSIFRKTFGNIYENIKLGVNSAYYINAVIYEYKSYIYKRYFKTY
jgi:hypothetical protein